MEESISSSRTYSGDADCYASGGPPAGEEDSEDSGWTAYFYDDDNYLQQLQASEEEPATAPREKKPHRHSHGHGDRASASTVSTASKTRAREKKAGAELEEKKKKRPRCEPADEDPLQDTASSQPENTTREVQLQEGWQIAGVVVSRDHHTQRCSGSTGCSLQETHMGLPGEAGCRKEGFPCLIN